MAEAQERVFKKGEVIYRQGQYEMFLYDILYGSVALYQNYGTKEQVLIKEMNQDGYFGEMELIEAMPRTTTAVATERTTARVYTAEDFGALFCEKPSMVMAIMQQMSARIRELTREYNDACRVVAESMAAEKAGKEKSGALQKERKKLSDYYHSYLRLLGGNLVDD
ncbi:MAG: Crp/Fnr family transcriptional regulator [Ruminococcaceae bacterium]|jgi:CRP-like cAMP-binding protein|nr:Crp/Fnr family transcriptional regulator [Oscillospiraceae bacterium]